MFFVCFLTLSDIKLQVRTNYKLHEMKKRHKTQKDKIY